MKPQDRMGDDSMDNLSHAREIDYSNLHQAITSEDRAVRKSARFSGQIRFLDKHWIYTDYIFASEATAQSIIQNFENDGIKIVFIKERDGTLGLADSRFVSQANKDVPGSVETVASDVWRILG